MLSEKVFVYGTLKQGEGNHSIISSGDHKFLGSVFTRDSYVMVSFGGFPAVFDVSGIETPIPKLPIMGELYMVSKEVMNELDALEGYPHFYDRQLAKIEDNGTAWMYVCKDIADIGRPVVSETNGFYCW